METKTESKKMDKNTKIAFGIIGSVIFVVLAIVGISAATKKKKETGGGGITPDGKPENKPNWFQTTLGGITGAGTSIADAAAAAIKGSAPIGTSWKVSYFTEKTKGATDLVVEFVEPLEPGTIKSNDKIKLTGMGNWDDNYRVYYNKGLWYNNLGKIGAIYINTGKATKDMKYTISPTLYPDATVTKR